jgi:hypothetical protein
MQSHSLNFFEVLHVLSMSECYTVQKFVEQYMGARNLVGIGLSYWSVRRHRLRNRFLGIDSLESIPGLLKSLKIPSPVTRFLPLLHLQSLEIENHMYYGDRENNPIPVQYLTIGAVGKISACPRLSRAFLNFCMREGGLFQY